MQVDTAVLVGLAASLIGQAGVIAQIDPSGDASAGASAMKDTATGAVVAGIADPIRAGYAQLSTAIAHMSSACAAGVKDYGAMELQNSITFQNYDRGAA